MKDDGSVLMISKCQPVNFEKMKTKQKINAESLLMNVRIGERSYMINFHNHSVVYLI